MRNLVLLNGKYLNESEAAVSVNNRSFRYGDGCFETIKVINGKINLATFHVDRLFFSLQLLQFELPTFFTTEFVLRSIQQLTEKNRHQKRARVRLCIFADNGSLYDIENRRFNYLIQSWPLDLSSNTLNENGLVIGTYPNGFKAADNFANIKSNNFLLYSMAAIHAKKNYWNDALVLNHKETFADTSIANFFIIQDKNILTPPLTDGPVNGTMRRYLLQSLPALGFRVKEDSINLSQFLNADECFLTNAIYGLKWVKQFENINFKIKHIYTIYNELIRPLWGRN